MGVVRVSDFERQFKEVGQMARSGNEIRIRILSNVDQSPVVLEDIFPHLPVMKFQGFGAAFLEVFDKGSFQEVCARGFVYDTPEVFPAQEYLVTTRARDLPGVVLLRKTGEVGKAFPIQEYYAFTSPLGQYGLRMDVIMEFARIHVQIRRQERHAQVGESQLKSQLLQNGPEHRARDDVGWFA